MLISAAGEGGMDERFPAVEIRPMPVTVSVGLMPQGGAMSAAAARTP